MAAAEIYDAIILGAGGAGLMCALVAGQRGARVLVIDHADEPGKKILISGGGALQLHQYWRCSRSLYLGKPTLRQIGNEPVHAV